MTVSNKKLAKLLEKGRLTKIKRYLKYREFKLLQDDPSLSAGDAWMEEIKVRSRRHNYGNETHLFHLTASIGDERVLRHLLKLGFGRRLGAQPQKGDQNTPLHLVVRRCRATLKSRGSKAAIEDFQDFVKPVLDACPEALTVKNQLGESGAIVLQELQSEIAESDNGNRNERLDSIVNNENDDDEFERMWRQKLEDECVFEFAENSGRYFNEDYEDGERRETFAEFADRIERECRQKYLRHSGTRRADSRSESASGSNIERPPNKLGKPLDPERQKQYEEMKKIIKLKNAKLDYEKKWDDFGRRNNGEELSFADLPWPLPVDEKYGATRILVREMVEVCVFVVNEVDRERERRLQLKRWHPDKIAQKFSLRSADSQFVLNLSKELVQALNSLKHD